MRTNTSRPLAGQSRAAKSAVFEIKHDWVSSNASVPGRSTRACYADRGHKTRAVFTRRVSAGRVRNNVVARPSVNYFSRRTWVSIILLLFRDVRRRRKRSWVLSWSVMKKKKKQRLRSDRDLEDLKDLSIIQILFRTFRFGQHILFIICIRYQVYRTLDKPFSRLVNVTCK